MVSDSEDDDFPSCYVRDVQSHRANVATEASSMEDGRGAGRREQGGVCGGMWDQGE